MYTHILVPLDGSQLAEAVLSFAEALALTGSGTLYLVRAATAKKHSAAQRYLENQVTDLRGRRVAAEALVLPGEPGEVIVEAAQRYQADLITMTTRGPSSIQRWMVGSVADEVLHRTAAPVLLVGAQHTAPVGWPRRALVPLDGSDLATRALGHARAMVRPGGELVLYQALTSGIPYGCIEPHGAVWNQVIADTRQEADAYLENLATPLREKGYEVRTVADFGVPARQIAEHARQAQADVIVLSSHGRAGATRWLLASVADELVRGAPVPLLLLRPLLAAKQTPVPLARPEPVRVADSPARRDSAPDRTASSDSVPGRRSATAEDHPRGAPAARHDPACELLRPTAPRQVKTAHRAARA